MGADDTISAQLRVEIEQWTQGFAQASAGVSSFVSGILSSLGPEGVAAAAVVAFAAVVGGSLESATKAYASFELSIDSLSRKVEASGVSWQSVKDGLMGYLEEIQATTRFSEEDAAAALDKLMQRTNNYDASLRLLNQAMNLAAFAHIPLTEAANMLGLAYEGNQRGLLQLGRMLGMTSQESKNAQGVFDELAKRTDGLAASERNLSKDLDQQKNTWHDVALIIGQAFGPAVVAVNTFIVNVFHGTLWFTVNLFQNLASVLNLVIVSVYNVGRAIADLATGHLKDLHQIATDEHVQIAATLRQIVDEWRGHEQAKTKATVDESKKRITDAHQATDILKGLVHSELQYYEQANKQHLDLFDALNHSLLADHRTYIQGKEETDDAYKERVKADQAELKKEVESVYQNIQQMSKDLADSISAHTKTWTTNFIAGTASVGDFFKAIAEGILQDALKAIGKSLIEQGASYIAQATAALMTGFGAAAAPGLFAAAAEVSGAGGVIEALADTVKLAGGGITSGPTFALIGDNPGGREAVVPLPERGDLLGGGGGDIHIHGGLTHSFPNVRNAADVANGRFGQSAARAFLEGLQDVVTRTGQRRFVLRPA